MTDVINLGDPRNASQLQYWNSARTAPWVVLQERLDKFFEPLSRAAMHLAAVQPGEHALDIGCGCGANVLDLADRVGSTGSVLGVDISSPMLDHARKRIAAAGLGNATVELADASVHPFKPGYFDLVFSRLGVMFFADPVRAFANIHRALRPGGRMSLVCCRTLAENAYINAGIEAALPFLPPNTFPPSPPDEPGMFAFADAARVQHILTAAGFKNVALTALDTKMHVADAGAAEDGAAFSVQFGPLPRALGLVDAEGKKAIITAITQAYRRIETSAGIELDGAFWVITART